MNHSPVLPARTCPDCGATLENAGSCQEVFDSFLVLEFTDPAYGAVHMLTVACFMLQHRRYSRPALHWIEKTLRAHLEQGVPPEEIRQQARLETSSGQRAWKVLRQPDEAPLPALAWSMTITDVATEYQDAQGYCQLVRRWVRTCLAEMQPWLAAIPGAKS